MNPGKLNKRISVQDEVKISDGAGGYELDHVKVLDAWANIDTLSGRDFWQAQQMEVEVSHKVTMRYRQGVKRSQVVFYNNRKFDIQYIFNPNEGNAYLELYCLERM